MRFVKLCCAMAAVSAVVVVAVVLTATTSASAAAASALIPAPDTAQEGEGAPQGEGTNAADASSVSKPDTAETSTEPFIPTDEWQEVKPGQAIPAGLHVSIDMQTGVKKAKKLSGTEGRPTLSEKRAAKLELAAQLLEAADANATNASNSTSKGSRTAAGQLPLNATESESSGGDGQEQRIRQLADALAHKWEKQPLPHQEEGIRTGHRVLRRISDTTTADLLSSSAQELITGLEDLEDVLHDGEVAIELQGAGLLPLLRDLLVDIAGRADTADPAVVERVLAQLCLTLGTSMQNNPPVAKELATPTLSRVASSLLSRPTQRPTLQKRALYLLASMVRSRPVLVAAWVHSHGKPSSTPRENTADTTNTAGERAASPAAAAAATNASTVMEDILSYHRQVAEAAASVPASLLRKTTTLLADAIEAEMRVVCPDLMDPKRGQTGGSSARSPHELSKAEMARVRSDNVNACAPATTAAVSGVCDATVAAWLEQHHDVALQEALLELLSMLPCDWTATRHANTSAGAILNDRMRAWQTMAARDEEGDEGVFGYLANLAAIVAQRAAAPSA